MLLSLCCVALAPIVGIVSQEPKKDDASAARTAWLREHAVGLKTVEAGNGFADLAPLKAMIGDARVVGLGEGTHGTREHFQMKHRLFEFLASEMGFTLFSIEANLPEAYALDAYVLGEDGDVDALIGGMYFWTWNTEEVRALVEWMRGFNAREKAKGSERRVHFTGFDMQTGTVALKNAIDFLESYDPEYLESVQPKLAELASFSPHGAGGGAFGCATGRFPVDLARGKKIRFTGSIKTEGVDAWAGLWWRVDGPTQVFDNMQDRGPHGTLDWQPAEIELEVPADAQAIFFGLVMPGSGKAWFDGLSIEIDGKPWSDAAFDLDFEQREPKGVVPADPSGGPASSSYAAEIDATVVKSGRSSFRLERLAPKGLEPEGAEQLARSLVEHMESERKSYARDADERAADWAIENARVVHQWTQLATDPGGGFEVRDRSMAENAAWILGRDPGAKIVLWAHNWHVRDEAPFMGSHLRKTFGDDYVNLAFCSSHGEYYAMPAKSGGERVHKLADPVEGSFESILESDGRPLLLVDLRTAKAGDPGSGWLTESRPFAGIIGALEMPAPYSPAKLQGHFDLLLYTRDTTAARQLGSRPARK